MFNFVASSLGAYFWIRKNLWFSAKNVLETSTAHFDYNLDSIKESCEQRSDSIVAFSLIAIGSFSQFILLFISPTIDSFMAFSYKEFLVLCAMFFIFWWVGKKSSHFVQDYLYSKVIQHISKPK
jgi:hypothetical protein